MRITTRGRYALRASLALARFYDNNSPISVNQLSEEEQISSIFLEQIFFKLRKAGIVYSVRGPGGGFQFARAPDKIMLKEILEAAGEELNITDCDKKAKTCSKTEKRCAAHTVWMDLAKTFNGYLSTTTLASVLERGIPGYP